MLDRLRSFRFHIAQRILSRWIRPTILGCDNKHLSLNETDAVCYVLPARSIADLLVTDQACQSNNLPRPIDSIKCINIADNTNQSKADKQARQQIHSTMAARAFFFLAHPEGALGRKTQRSQSARMLSLVEQQPSLANNIKIVPVSLYWGHQPDKEKSIFKQLLSDNWTASSRFKKLLAGIFHRNHILVQFSQPIDLRSLINSEPDQHKQVRKLLRLARVHFNRQRQAIIGPDLSHRRTLINSMLSSSNVQRAIDQVTQESKKSRTVIEKRALNQANEIAAHQSYRVVRFFHILLTWLWNKLYDGIEISNIDTAREFARTHEIIYIPCHRSHIDYLLLSYVLYQNGLTPPHIAAGKNLNLPIVGPLLRRGGAFFMRRSFRDDPLYKAVFDEYLYLMFSRGYSVEYFIEGGRSRTGRTLTPRTGMLSMTLRSFQRNASKPIAFLPVYFGYERILEAATYMGELAGKTKLDESIFDIFGIFKTIKQPFGKVCVNFGEAVKLDQFLDQQQVDWRNTSQTPAEFSLVCNQLAILLAQRINQAVAITPINLLACAVLSTPQQIIAPAQLESQLLILQQLANLIQHPNSKATVTQMPAIEIVSHGEKIIGLQRQPHEFGDLLYANSETTNLLTYYRNNSLHAFIFTALIARYICHQDVVNQTTITDYCIKIYPLLQAEFFLDWPPEETAARCQQIIAALISLGLILRRPSNGEPRTDNLAPTSLALVKITPPSTHSAAYANLILLAELVDPTLQRYHISMTLLAIDKQWTIKAFVAAAVSIAKQLSAIYGINTPEFSDPSLFTGLINSLATEDYLSIADQNITRQPSLNQLNHQISNNLAVDIRHKISQLMNQLIDSSMARKKQHKSAS
ncbi:MAG: glycerol-3-phosphate 1-O-acyltransferase PlsB [Pseudomonadales bacterium]|nr:glycerol-3-phosphate 1-O-acyltransferase PlsB [Pseudomonadales bacterium]